MKEILRNIEVLFKPEFKVEAYKRTENEYANSYFLNEDGQYAPLKIGEFKVTSWKGFINGELVFDTGNPDIVKKFFSDVRRTLLRTIIAERKVIIDIKAHLELIQEDIHQDDKGGDIVINDDCYKC